MSACNKKLGYSLVEMLIYVAILAFICIVVVSTITSFSQSYRNITALRLLDHSANDSLERMTRDIRASISIDLTNSLFGTSPGVLVLQNNSTTTKFYIFNKALQVDVNNASSGPITNSKASITNLVFTKISNSISVAIKIDMTISATDGQATKTKIYHSTIISKKAAP